MGRSLRGGGHWTRGRGPRRRTGWTWRCRLRDRRGTRGGHGGLRDRRGTRRGHGGPRGRDNRTHRRRGSRGRRTWTRNSWFRGRKRSGNNRWRWFRRGDRGAWWCGRTLRRGPGCAPHRSARRWRRGPRCAPQRSARRWRRGPGCASHSGARWWRRWRRRRLGRCSDRQGGLGVTLWLAHEKARAAFRAPHLEPRSGDTALVDLVRSAASLALDFEHAAPLLTSFIRVWG